MIDLANATKKIISFKCLFWGAVWLYGIGLLILWVLRWWSEDLWLPVRLCNYFMPWLLVGLLPGIALALLTNRALLATVLGVSTLFIVITYAPLFMPRQEKSPDGIPLKVMSYNVWWKNSNVAGMAEVIRTQKPDLLLLQEIDRDRLNLLVKDLDGLYSQKPYVVFEEHEFQAMISHFPLAQVAEERGTGRTQKVVVMTSGGPITVLNVHAARNNGWQRRHEKILKLITDEIAGDTDPLILGGDFNTTDQSQTYRLVARVLQNAHWKAGWGFGFSYPSSAVKLLGYLSIPPLIRIDHIFYNKRFVAKQAETLTASGGSDHFPIIADLILKRK